jgi:hypothetical protein
MASANTPTLQTELEAVNILLDSIGEAPVNTLNNPGLLDAVKSQSLLHEVSRHTQLKGWSFNTEKDYTLSLDGDNQLPLPANTLGVSISKTLYPTLNAVQRGLKLYDISNQTFTFTQNYDCTLRVFLAWDELPEVFKKYVTIRSARIFQDRALGASELHKYQNQDEYEALIDLKESEGETTDTNVFDNLDTIRIINRSI